ncbi:Assembly factor cbp4 [Lecanosticta acicola]|uniref:Cytochrome b mRNA-processing protein 4 n=1 Tax=Lecanosticta acicola TaxID=111012 RepID=A0AAI8YXN2_9PEZI|nr:Assembly factor cbp4 [Lecanosticta acicola]
MKTITYVKMAAAGAVMCIGGPALIYYVSPTEEELFLKYNPDLQRRSLANRQEKQEDFDRFVGRLKEYSKDDRPIWTVWEKDIEARRKVGVQAELDRRKAEEEMKREVRESIK